MHVPENWPPCQPLSLLLLPTFATTACMHRATTRYRPLHFSGSRVSATGLGEGGEDDRIKERERESLVRFALSARENKIVKWHSVRNVVDERYTRLNPLALPFWRPGIVTRL